MFGGLGENLKDILGGPGERVNLLTPSKFFVGRGDGEGGRGASKAYFPERLLEGPTLRKPRSVFIGGGRLSVILPRCLEVWVAQQMVE